MDLKQYRIEAAKHIENFAQNLLNSAENENDDVLDIDILACKILIEMLPEKYKNSVLLPFSS
ncbi:MAG: hypothetical protein RLZZ203_1145 [Cyanobacteriota bacterium]|jgi:hypothetical protein